MAQKLDEQSGSPWNCGANLSFSKEKGFRYSRAHVFLLVEERQTVPKGDGGGVLRVGKVQWSNGSYGSSESSPCRDHRET